MARCEMKTTSGTGTCKRNALYKAKGKYDTKYHKYCGLHAKTLKKYGWVKSISKL